MTFDEVTAVLAARWGFELPAEWLEESAVTFFIAPANSTPTTSVFV
jgi:hypothetical protein